MSINNKSLRIRGWADALHLTRDHKPSFEKAIRLLSLILGETVSPRYYNYVKRELEKVVAQHPDLSVEQLKILGTLQDKLGRKVTLIQERAEKRKAKKAAEESKKAKQTPAAPAPPQEEDSVWLH